MVIALPVPTLVSEKFPEPVTLTTSPALKLVEEAVKPKPETLVVPS